MGDAGDLFGFSGGVSRQVKSCEISAPKRPPRFRARKKNSGQNCVPQGGQRNFFPLCWRGMPRSRQKASIPVLLPTSPWRRFLHIDCEASCRQRSTVIDFAPRDFRSAAIWLTGPVYLRRALTTRVDVTWQAIGLRVL